MGELIRMLSIARQQWFWILAGILLSVLVICANALLMAVSGWFIASMAVAGASGVGFNYFMPAAAIRFFAIIRTVGRYVERLVTHEAGFRVLATLRVWLFRCVVPLSPAGLERYTSGDVAGRLRSDIDALESLYLRILLPLVTGGATMVLATLFVAWWSYAVAIVLLLFLIVSGIILPLCARQWAQEPGSRVTSLAGELRAIVTEGLQGSEELILLGAVELQAARVELVSTQLMAEQERLARINGVTMAGGLICGGAGVAAVLSCAGSAVVTGELAGPLLVMLLLFAAASFEAVAGMPAAMQQIPGAREAVRRIRALVDAPLPVVESAVVAQLPASTDITFRNVSFAYDATLPVLQGFSLTILAGQWVALAGRSGCGKSTVAQLLLRFRPYQGSITLGGVELADLAIDDYLQLVAAVPQQPHIFNTTIRENILLAKPKATNDELRQAVADATLADWVASLPEGLETRVGEGGSAVSGGEGRRIAVARALLKDAPIIILDEPTEGLDLATERALIMRLAVRLAGKTVLIISHRPACLSFAERVVWLEDESQFENTLHSKPEERQLAASDRLSS